LERPAQHKGPAFRHVTDGWRVEGGAFSVADAVGGAAMPTGWRLENYATRDGVLIKERGESPDLVYRRTQQHCVLTISSEPLQASDVTKPLSTIAKKSLGAFRTEYGPARREAR
jgi:hypothetical protein